MDFPILLGKRIKELRNRVGLSQDQAAEQAGICGKYLGQVERGEVNVSAVIIYKLSLVLNVTIEDFYDFDHHSDISEVKLRLHEYIDTSEEENIKFLYKIILSLPS